MSTEFTTVNTVIEQIPTTLVGQPYNIVGQYTTLDSKLIKQSLNLYNTSSLDPDGNPTLVNTNYCAMGAGGLEILAYDVNNPNYRSITYYSVQGLQASVMNIDNPLIKSTSLTCGSSGTESNVGTSSSDTSLSRYFSTVSKSNFTTSQTGTQYNFADKLTLKTTATLNQFLVDNNAGTSGHVLTSGGSGGSVSWSAPATDPNVVPLTTPPDSATLAVNNSVKIQNGETGSESNYIELSSDSGNNTLSLSGAFGTSGQVLTTGGSAGSLSWTTPVTTVPNLSQVLTSGNSATDIYITLLTSTSFSRNNSLEYDGMHTDYNNMQVVATGDNNGMLWTNNKLVMAPRGGNPVSGWGGLCEYNMGYSGVINIPEALQHMGLDFAYGGPTSQFLDMQYKSTGTDPNGFFFQNYDGTGANFLHTEISQAMTGATTHNFLMYRKPTAGAITKQININQDNIVMTDNTSGVVTSTLDADNLQLAKTSVYTHDIKNNTSTNYLDLSSTVGVAIGATSLPLSLRGNVDAVTSLTANSGALVFYGGTAGASTAVSYTVPSSGVNREFYLTLTGTTASQVITLPTARNGYTIYITNLSTQSWTVNRAGTDVIYGGPNGPGGATSFTIVSNKAYELFQSTSSFVFVGETATRTVLTVTSINSSQLNPNAPAYTRAVADCVEQFGTITTGGATTGTLTFPKAYSAAPCVTITVVNSAVASNAGTITSLSGTAFNWHVAGATATSICWRATGSALATL